ncbi:protein-methionine-sulfoxide reductase heme-binding subunit MsrQ [Oceanobacter kriegii]|uniref:sulfite oxidase heme-binding subunit YedZ n=1 Tax=Oceanobacter kriegii TaxID=64972 RepID=UPI000562D1DA|nr:protein-methionine-sulfoxide reductase heme-binding subunit MsrQ [Oceanobacter kriegii]
MNKTIRKLLVFIGSLLPLGWILWKVVRLQSGEWDVLGPEPGRAIVFFTGTWTFVFLLLGLAASTFKRWGVPWLMMHRRMIGLFAFFYATLHLLAYMAFLLEWQWADIASEIIERPYLTFGFAGWALLVPLAFTSLRYWQRKLGKRWKRLHQLAYVVAVLVAVHYLLQIRSNWFEPVLYSSLMAILLLERAFFVLNKRIKTKI